MKQILTLIIAGLFLLLIVPQNSFSQRSDIKPKSSHKREAKKISREEVLKNIDKNTKSFKKDSRGSWLLEEDFESGIFPPSGWTVDYGYTEWEQYYGVSGYGNGMICMYYSSWNCNYSDNKIYTSNFSPTQSGDKLIFDYAYAPYDDKYPYYDALEIFYYDDYLEDWYSLIYYEGYELQTSAGIYYEFFPQSNEWGTKIVDIPANATQIYFQVYENCSNNLFIDNIKVGTVSGGNDASVEIVWAKGKLPLVYGVPDKIPVLIRNNGVSSINNLKVYLNISGANNLLDSLVIPSIGPLDTAQVDFLGFNPVLNGFSDVTVTIPDDDNNANNSKTFITEVNPNKIRYVDSACCNSGVGWVGENAFMTKYNMSGTGQIRKVNIKISGDLNNIGQIVYGYVVNSSGVVVGKSPHYKLQLSDIGKYKSFNITDPKPVIVSNNFYYVGIAQTEYSGNQNGYGPLQVDYEIPSIPDANYFTNLVPAGSSTYGVYQFGRSSGLNFAIEAEIGDQAAVDAGISDMGPVYEQYFNSNTYSPVGKVFNAGTGPQSFSVRRTITPGGYTSTKSVVNLGAGSSASVTFDPWTFISGTAYTVRDSVLISDGNNSNNQMTTTITPRIAKELCVMYAHQKDRDSLVRAILNDGRYENNFDTVGINYTGSFSPWKILMMNFKEDINYSSWVRDSMKMFLDNSTAGNKKTLVVFGDAIASKNDPIIGFPNPADTVFYRQYLKARTISEDWVGNIPDSESKFRGIGFFEGITQDSVSDPYTPELIKPANGSSAAFKPLSVTGNGADSCIAVNYAGANYNTFFMTNQFSSLRATNSSPSSPLGPVRVYNKIIDWIQSSNTGVKVLDLTAEMEGFYDPVSNLMAPDTMRVFLRSYISPYPVVDSAKSYLNAAGQGSFVFSNVSNGVGYYIQLKHRNGLETWSKTPQSFSSNHLAYDFTTNADKAYGDNLKLSGSKWVVYAGDADQNGVIDLFDLVLIYNQSVAFSTGYTVTDVNGDNITDLTDVILCYNNSTAFVEKIAPSSEPLVNPGLVQDKDFNANNNVKDSDVFETDNEIYERHMNEQPKQALIPDLYIQEKGKGISILKGKDIRR